MPKESAGILIYRRSGTGIEVLLAHPGGPFFRNKDEGSWTIPKGEIDPSEDAEAAALRELAEETGFAVDGPLIALDSIRQKGGKIVHVWAVEADVDPEAIESNTFTITWPPRSGRDQSFPEIDRVEYFDLETAAVKIIPAQVELLTRLVERCG